MPPRSVTSITLFFLLACTVSALQVSPGSPCAAICLDQGNQNVTDPTSSNTFSTDVVCQDTDYVDLDEGRKFKACSRCLQESGASTSEENDQSWFLYNLRFTVSSCLFDWSNATEGVCSTQTTCGPLQNAIQADSLDPSKNTWSYCSKDDNSFLGANLAACVSCLRTSKTQQYLANFLVALQAGCVQRPATKIIIGVEGDLFSTTPAKMANSGHSATSTGSEPRKGLSQGAIIGIAIGAGIPVLTGIALLIFFCLRRGWHKRGSRAKMSRLASPLDSRFGSTSISSPMNTSYADPYTSPRIGDKEMSTSALTPTDPGGFIRPATAPRSILKAPGGRKGKLGITTNHTRNQSNPSATLPTHQAYIPSDPTPVSPISATSTLAPLPFSSPIYASLKPSPQHDFSTPGQRTRSKSPESSRIYSPALHSSQGRNAFKDESVRIFVPTNFQETPETAPPLSAFHTQAHGRSRTHSQTGTGSRNRSRSRSNSRSRGNGPTRTESVRVTALAGLGNSNASQQQEPVRPRIVDPSAFEVRHNEKDGHNGKGVEMQQRGRGRVSDDSPATSEGGDHWGNY